MRQAEEEEDLEGDDDDDSVDDDDDDTEDEGCKESPSSCREKEDDPDGGGGASDPSPEELLEASRRRVKERLSIKGCARHFRNMDDVLAKIGQVAFLNLGQIKFETENGVIKRAKNSGPLAVYGRLNGAIRLNSQVNWADPTHQSATLDGKPYVFDGLVAMASALGTKYMTAAEFMDLVMLHELMHYRGTGNPDDITVEKQMWIDCFRYQ